MDESIKTSGSLFPDKEESRTVEGLRRTGRVSLWAMFAPLGFWLSYRHGRRKANEQLAKDIAKELKR